MQKARSHHPLPFQVHPNQTRSQTSSQANKLDRHPEKCSCCCCSCATKKVCIAFGIADVFIAVCKITFCALFFYFLKPLRDIHGHTEKEHEKEVKNYERLNKARPEKSDLNRTEQEYMFKQHREAHYANIGLVSFETYILLICSILIIYAAIRYSSSLCKFYIGFKLFLMALNIFHLVIILIITSDIRKEYRSTDLILPIVIQFEVVLYLLSICFAYQLKLAAAVGEFEEITDDERLVTSALIVSTSSRRILRLLEKTQERANESVSFEPHNYTRDHHHQAIKNQK